jgi:hypothetical protein
MSKPISKKVRKIRNEFKKKIKEAKKYKREHPNTEWKNCVKHVWKK